MDTIIASLNDTNVIKIGKIVQIDELVKILRHAKEQYENTGCAIMTNYIYDRLEEILRERNPVHPFFKETAHVDGKHQMFSLDKFVEGRKDTERKIKKWVGKYNGQCVWGDKADGLTMRLKFVKGKLKQVCTHYQDIPHAISYFQTLFDSENIKNVLPGTIYIRGEVIIERTFNEDVKKIRGKSSNLRHVVCGLMNSNAKEFKTNPILKYVRFYGFELIDMSMKKQHKPSLQYELLRKAKIPTVYYKSENCQNLTVSSLKKLLLERNKNSAINIDGIVVRSDTEESLPTDRNPKYAFAFKSPGIEMTRDVIVTGITWNKSKGKRYRPVIEFDQVELDGSKVSKATGHNAKKVVTEGIGVGAVVRVQLSGKIIPKIVQVVKKASIVSLPKDGFWNDTHTHLCYESNGKDQLVISLANFFKVLNTEQLRKSTVKKLVNAGFDSVQSIIEAGKDDFLKVDGAGEKSADAWVIAIRDSLMSATQVQIAQASDCFSCGKDETKIAGKKLEKIMSALPTSLEKNAAIPTLDDLVAIKGVALKTAEKFQRSIPMFKKFLANNPTLGKIFYDQRKKSTASNISKTGTYSGQVIVITGTRDKMLMQKLKNAGATFGSSVTAKTTLVIAADPNKMTGKIKKAKKMGIPIKPLTDFEHML